MHELGVVDLRSPGIDRGAFGVAIGVTASQWLAFGYAANSDHAISKCLASFIAGTMRRANQKELVALKKILESRVNE